MDANATTSGMGVEPGLDLAFAFGGIAGDIPVPGVWQRFMICSAGFPNSRERALKFEFMNASRLERRSAATVALVLALMSAACASRNPPKPSTGGLLPKPKPEASFPAPLPGDKTEGVNRVLEVLDWLGAYARGGRNPANRVGFQLPESEVNEYLAYALRINPRPGLSSVTLKLLPNSEISSLVWIDFDALTKWNSWILPAPLRSLLNGRMAVRVDAHLDARNGFLNFTVKDAYGPAGAMIARKVVEDVMQSIGLHQRELYNTGQPIPLPFGLKSMWCEKQLLAGET